jgi:hypothetical protein
MRVCIFKPFQGYLEADKITFVDLHVLKYLKKKFSGFQLLVLPLDRRKQLLDTEDQLCGSCQILSFPERQQLPLEWVEQRM